MRHREEQACERSGRVAIPDVGADDSGVATARERSLHKRRASALGPGRPMPHGSLRSVCRWRNERCDPAHGATRNAVQGCGMEWGGTLPVGCTSLR